MKILLVLLGCLGISQQVPSIAVAAVRPAGQTTDRASWNQIEVSPSPYMSVVVFDKFRVPVYKKDTSEEFYYSPALIIDPNTAKTTFSQTRKRFELNFKVLMWDNLFEKTIQAALSDKMNKTVPLNSIRTLPIEEIRLEFTGYASTYEVDNNWSSYASQPSIFTFRLYCIKNETCTETLHIIQHDTEAFLQAFTVHYSLQTQKSVKRQITVKAEHVQAGNLYSTLLQTVASKENVIYLQADDAKTLSQEIAMNVLATVVEDEEFISQDQDVTITSLLDRVLQMKTVYTDENFNEQMWSSTFWNEDNARPDLVTHTLNELYNKSETELQDAIKEEVKKPSLLGTVVGGLGPAVGLIPGVGPVAGGITTVISPVLAGLIDSSHSLSKPDQQRLKKVILQARQKSEWNGQKFTPKPMELRRVNLSAFKSATTIGVVQAKVTRTASELSSSINFIGSSDSILQERKSQFQTGFIMATFVAKIPAGWLACDGTPVDRELYPELHVITGGFTPDLQGRFPVGRNPNEVLGMKGGEAMHRLTPAEMPYHTHKYTAVHDWSSNLNSGGGNNGSRESRAGGTSGAGGDQPHNNLPPFLTVNFIIKT